MEPHILFVDDDPDTRELVEVLLRSEGFRVSLAITSADVLPLISTEHFDALLLDNRMPGLNGIELCRQIRSFDRSTPILFCSGAATEADKRDALLVGAQGYLTKPFDPNELIAALHSALKGRAS